VISRREKENSGKLGEGIEEKKKRYTDTSKEISFLKMGRKIVTGTAYRKTGKRGSKDPYYRSP